MESLKSVVNDFLCGFLFGSGMLLAALVMRLLFHISWCG